MIWILVIGDLTKNVLGKRICPLSYLRSVAWLGAYCNKGNPSVSGVVGSGWSPLRNLGKRIIRERGIGGWW